MSSEMCSGSTVSVFTRRHEDLDNTTKFRVCFRSKRGPDFELNVFASSGNPLKMAHGLLDGEPLDGAWRMADGELRAAGDAEGTDAFTFELRAEGETVERQTIPSKDLLGREVTAGLFRPLVSIIALRVLDEIFSDRRLS